MGKCVLHHKTFYRSKDFNMNKKPTVKPVTLVRVNKNFNVEIKRVLWKINYWLINASHIVEMLITFELFKKVTNWQMLLMDYIGLLRHGQGIIKLRNGAKFTIRWGTTDKWSIHEIVLRDDYRIKDIASECRVVFDIGASIGDFSIYTAFLNKRAKIFAYEPDPENFKQLSRNMKLNDLSSRMMVFQEACAEKSGYKKLYQSLHQGGHSLVKKTKGKFINVHSQSLKEIFVKNKIKTCDLLKLDVEGAEYEILYSLGPAILGKIKCNTMEYHNINKENDQDGKSLKKYLKGHGFSVTQKESLKRRVGSIFAINTRQKQ